MKSHVISLGRILGIPVGLDYSWFLIFALLTWTLASSYFPAEFNDWSPVEYWIVGAVTAAMLFVSVVLHELGHSVVARSYKVTVRRITLFIFGGVAEIASEPPSAKAEFWIAVAGPIVSFTLAGIFALARPLVTNAEPVLALAMYLAYINGTLGLFNLIPGFPLDGGRVFRAIVWAATKSFQQATHIAANVGRFIAFGFILFGVWQMLGGNLVSGLWIAFIGWFLESAAVGQLHQMTVTRLLSGHKVEEAMSSDFITVSEDATLERLVEEQVLAGGKRSFVVMHVGKPVGLLTLHQIREVPRDRWDSTTVGTQMIPLNEVRVTRPEMEIMEALKEMDQDGVNQLPVMVDSRVVGTLSRESVITYLRNLQELGM
jgi:Zn-dependent protease/CBS domain-containing protein